jgi:hypothetical protein
VVEALFAALGGLAVGFAAGVAAGSRRAAPRRSEPAEAPVALSARPAPAATTVQAVRAGGRLRLVARGDEAEDLDLAVVRFDRYTLGRDTWHLLEGSYRGRTVALEWSDARGELRLFLHRRPGQPLDALGVDPAALERLAVGEALAAGGAAWRCEAAGKALRHEGGAGFGKEHRAWTLTSPDGLLRLARWGDLPAQGSVAERVEADAVEVRP